MEIIYLVKTIVIYQLPIGTSDKVYFPLKMVDLDGSFEYSSIRSLTSLIIY